MVHIRRDQARLILRFGDHLVDILASLLPTDTCFSAPNSRCRRAHVWCTRGLQVAQTQCLKYTRHLP